MHASATAELPHLTFAALARACPVTVAELLEAVLPYVPEVVAVDVALRIVAAYACATRYVAINAYRCYGNTSVTHVEVVAYLRLVASQEALAGVV